MGVANVPAASAAGLQPKYQKFTSSGTFTLPTGYGVSKPLLVNIQVIGGGGGGMAPFSTTNNGNVIGNLKFNAYFGHGNNWQITGSSLDRSINTDQYAGGSGGLAQTQMYLTTNLTITVGAAGTRPSVNTTYAFTTSNNILTNGYDAEPYIVHTSASLAGGVGGTSSAGSVVATGGNAGNGNAVVRTNSLNYNGGGNANTVDGGTYAHGTGGTPAGTAGGATPLLGTLAGGSGSSTSIKGSFGVGGIKTDGATATGVEGTGGGFGSIGASGAVILTWWE